MWQQLALIIAALLLVLLNGFFVAAEFAIVKVRSTRVAELVSQGRFQARVAKSIIEHLDAYLSATQLGITMASLGLGWIGEPAVAHLLEPVFSYMGVVSETGLKAASFAVGFAIISFLHIVLGELAPKSLAIRKPEATSLWVAIPLKTFYYLMYPAIVVLNSAANWTLRLVGLTPATEGEAAHSLEEIRMIVAATRAGAFHEKEAELVERIFRLADHRAASLMVPQVDIVWLPADASTDRVRVAVATSSHSHFPVCDPGRGLDKIIGVVHLKDLIQAGLLTKQIDLKILARKPLFVPETTPVLRLLDEFRRGQTHIAFVLDEYGVVTGLVTLNDVIESLVGPIARYGEEIEPLAVQRDDGSWLLDGGMPVEDLKGLMGVAKLPHEHRTSFQTVAGFVMTYLGRVPRTGEHFSFDRFRFEVVDMDRHRIDKVLLSFTAPASAMGIGKGA
jgi:putative hemolysin